MDWHEDEEVLACGEGDDEMVAEDVPTHPQREQSGTPAAAPFQGAS